MFTPLPKDSGENLFFRPLYGVLGLPNSCDTRWTFTSADGGVGDVGMCTCIGFEGVSGITLAPNVEAAGISVFRFFEIKPVDMNACGTAFGILYAFGVARASCDNWLGRALLFSGGRIAPMGSDFEKLGCGFGIAGFGKIRPVLGAC